MLQLIIGYWVSHMVHVAAKLGLADHVHDAPKTAEELARLTDAEPAAVHRLLRGLASVGVFREISGGRFEQTPLSDTLRAGAPASMRAFALMMVERYNVEAWSDLLTSVKTGEPAFERVHGMKVFEYLARHPEHGKVFGESMTSLSRVENPAVAEAYDFSGVRTLVDIGGGHGSLLATILRRNATLRGVLFDRAEVIERARKDEHVTAPEVAGRIELVAGDFFESVPQGADAYIMKYIMHDWEDESARRILQHCRRAMAPGGRVLVVDTVIPAGNEPFWGKLLDLNMLALTGGLERTEAQFAALFASAGLKLRRVVPTSCPLGIVEAVAD
jgi:SAM-dependent methyltransferase